MIAGSFADAAAPAAALSITNVNLIDGTFAAPRAHVTLKHFALRLRDSPFSVLATIVAALRE